MAFIQERLLFKVGFYSNVASIQGHLLFRATFIQGRLLFKGSFLFKSGFYLRVAFIQGRLLFKNGFCSQLYIIALYHTWF